MKAYESYVIANAATQASLKSISLDAVVTATEQIAVEPTGIRTWTSDGALHIEGTNAGAVYVYAMSGAPRAYLPSLNGSVSIPLPPPPPVSISCG